MKVKWLTVAFLVFQHKAAGSMAFSSGSLLSRICSKGLHFALNILTLIYSISGEAFTTTTDYEKMVAYRSLEATAIGEILSTHLAYPEPHSTPDLML